MFDSSLTVRLTHDVDGGRLQPGVGLVATRCLEGVEWRHQMPDLQVLDHRWPNLPLM